MKSPWALLNDQRSSTRTFGNMLNEKTVSSTPLRESPTKNAFGKTHAKGSWKKGSGGFLRYSKNKLSFE